MAYDGSTSGTTIADEANRALEKILEQKGDNKPVPLKDFELPAEFRKFSIQAPEKTEDKTEEKFKVDCKTFRNLFSNCFFQGPHARATLLAWLQEKTGQEKQREFEVYALSDIGTNEKFIRFSVNFVTISFNVTRVEEVEAQAFMIISNITSH